MVTRYKTRQDWKEYHEKAAPYQTFVQAMKSKNVQLSININVFKETDLGRF